MTAGSSFLPSRAGADVVVEAKGVVRVVASLDADEPVVVGAPQVAGDDGRLEEARQWARRAEDAAGESGAPSALAVAAWTTGEITALTDPVEAIRHLERAIELAAVADSRLVAGLAEVSMAALHARGGDPATALRYYQRVIPQWGHAGAWTPQWITLRTLIDLLARVGASRDAATVRRGHLGDHRRARVRRRRRPAAPGRGPAARAADRRRVPRLH